MQEKTHQHHEWRSGRRPQRPRRGLNETTPRRVPRRGAWRGALCVHFLIMSLVEGQQHQSCEFVLIPFAASKCWPPSGPVCELVCSILTPRTPPGYGREVKSLRPLWGRPGLRPAPPSPKNGKKEPTLFSADCQMSASSGQGTPCPYKMRILGLTTATPKNRTKRTVPFVRFSACGERKNTTPGA